MPRMIEVDEDEYRRDVKLRQTVATILANPKAKRVLQEAHKMADPAAITPELDADKALAEREGGIRKEFDDYRKEQADKEAKREQDDKMAALNARYEGGRAKLRGNKWTEDGIKAVEKIMEEQGILDHEIAAAYFEKQNPPQAPSMPGGTGAWNFLEMPTDTDADLKRLVETKGENNVLLDKMAQSALAEIRGVSRR